ncbi:MAG: hypothetical protein F4Y49_14345 [Dehalococcoidia bacterium]|nr:hypothetical protein [Dehalococcoidia bacterium]
MHISVIPSYRVMLHLARRASGLDYAEALDSMENGMRDYVRSQLAQMHSSLVELGVRSVIGQLGDPEPEQLMKALIELDDSKPQEVTRQALEVASRSLPRPDLSARMFIFPGDGESAVLVNQLGGVLAFSLGASATLLFVWPRGDWESNLRYNVVHEYAHLVRNLLFPRGIAGGRLVYMKTQQPETLLDAMVAEGISDCFAQECLNGARPRWMDTQDEVEPRRMWPRLQRRFGISDPTEIRRFLFGDGDRVPAWTGYTLGYMIVRRFLDNNPGTTMMRLVSMPASDVYDGSGIETNGLD